MCSAIFLVPPTWDLHATKPRTTESHRSQTQKPEEDQAVLRHENADAMVLASARLSGVHPPNNNNIRIMAVTRVDLLYVFIPCQDFGKWLIGNKICPYINPPC